MKKALLCLGLVLSIAACGSGGSGSESTSNPDISEQEDFEGSYTLLEQDCDNFYDMEVTQNGDEIVAHSGGQTLTGNVVSDADGSAIDFDNSACYAGFIETQDDADFINENSEITTNIGELVVVCDEGEIACVASYDRL